MNIIVKQRYTPEDLLKMPDGKDYELVDGQLVERKMGWESGWIGGQLYRFVAVHCAANKAGWVAPGESSYQCFPDAPDKVRRPDVSFIRADRLPQPPKGHCPVAPDLVAEVISPNDSYEEVEEKVEEYLGAGVRLVWVINPSTRKVRVHRLKGTVTDLGEADELDGEDVLPGFRCRVGELFAPPTGAPAVR